MSIRTESWTVCSWPLLQFLVDLLWRRTTQHLCLPGPCMTFFGEELYSICLPGLCITYLEENYTASVLTWALYYFFGGELYSICAYLDPVLLLWRRTIQHLCLPGPCITSLEENYTASVLTWTLYYFFGGELYSICAYLDPVLLLWRRTTQHLCLPGPCINSLEENYTASVLTWTLYYFFGGELYSICAYLGPVLLLWRRTIQHLCLPGPCITSLEENYTASVHTWTLYYFFGGELYSICAYLDPVLLLWRRTIQHLCIPGPCFTSLEENYTASVLTWTLYYFFGGELRSICAYLDPVWLLWRRTIQHLCLPGPCITSLEENYTASVLTWTLYDFFGGELRSICAYLDPVWLLWRRTIQHLCLPGPCMTSLEENYAASVLTWTLYAFFGGELRSICAYLDPVWLLWRRTTQHLCLPGPCITSFLGKVALLVMNFCCCRCREPERYISFCLLTWMEM